MTNDVARLGRLMRKELSEILRDRRTIITLVLMPVLLYPLLSVAFQQFFLANRIAANKEVEYVVGFIDGEEANRFAQRIQLGDHALQRKREKRPDAGAEDKSLPPKVTPLEDTWENLHQRLLAGQIDAIVRSKRPPTADYELFEIVYLPNSAGGSAVAAWLEARLAAANELDLRFMLRQPGLKGRPLVIGMVRAPLEATTNAPIISLASLVPLILILMTITGAVYPAIDLTAGERERGTLEILVAAPVPRLGLLFAKYVTVLTVAVLTALINLVAMTTTLILSGLGPILFGEEGWSLWTVIEIFGLLLLFAAFFSAVLLCITSFARSFKEAQAYLIPLMLVSLGPGVLGMMPGLKLGDLFWAPLVNIVLLARDLFEGRAELGLAVLVVASTLVYAAAAIALAARIFGSESVLYNDQSSWADLLRRPETPQPAAGLNAALWCLALMIPINFVIRGLLLSLRADLFPDGLRLVLGPTTSLVLFALLPGLFAWRGRVAAKSGFGMALPAWPTLVGGVILGFSLWPLVLWPMSLLGDSTLRSQYPEAMQNLIDFYRRLTIVERIFVVVVPAVVEEWFFRGFFYGAVRRHAGAVTTILLTSLLFGVAHWVLNIELGLARQLPSFALGLVIGTLREVSGSVWPGMALHVCHNSVLVMLLDADVADRQTIDTWWLLAGLGGSVAGAILVALGARRRVTGMAPGVR